jgi:hypothetical protein
MWSLKYLPKTSSAGLGCARGAAVRVMVSRDASKGAKAGAAAAAAALRARPPPGAARLTPRRTAVAAID